MAHLGVCALCHLDDELCESHLQLPRFVYKRLRQPGATNPNPVQISAAGIYQTSQQQKRILLCKKCENERFNKLGEHWTSQICLQDNNVSFPLLDLVKAAPHHVLDSNNAVFSTATITDFQHGALEYFAASMVWRGQFVSAHAKPPSYSLRNYESQFTNYLLGRASFPSDASLFIFVRYRSNLTQVSHGVRASRMRMAAIYSFSIPGITFQLALGRDRDRNLDEMSFNISPARPILDLSAVDEMNNDILVAVREQAQSRGRRARLSPSQSND